MLEAISWLFTVPVLKMAIEIGVAIAGLFLLVQIIRWALQSKAPNPFAKDDKQARRPYIIDQKKRDAILKQAFSPDKVPEDLDAIIIGSGIGGMTTAAVMAKAGKRVLVLEQHDQAGGCCHTFIDKGYEFDVGIHYIGKFGHRNLNKTLMEQISEGQVEWSRMDEAYDVVSIGYDDENRQYPVLAGFPEWSKTLKKAFPEEHEAIDRFFDLIKEYSASTTASVLLKMMPLWLSKLICATPLLNLLSKIWSKEKDKTTLEVVQGLTKDKDLQTIFCYCWGDYGTIPSKSHFNMQALLLSHFQHGGFYPVGGASEIALNMIPVIERNGGKVLVRCEVQQILYNGKKVHGVKVKKGSEVYSIEAPLVISNAGIYNTFQRLLPKQVSDQSYFSQICKDLKPGTAAMNVFLGLDASNEDLGLRPHNIWAFTSNDSSSSFQEFVDLDAERVLDAKAPLVFISFPSAKDPNWKNHPGRQNKSTCAIVTLANWDWFKQWQDKPVKRRGDDYDAIKNTLGEMLIEQTCKLFPQIRDHIDFKDIGSPLSNKYYLAQPHGEIYGLDHSKERFDPLMTAKLRPQTDVPGLYLTGQDVFSCGFTGALYGGLMAAGSVLERNVMTDLINLHKKLGSSEKKKKMD